MPVAFSEIARSFLLDKQHPEGRTSLKIADFPFPFSINIPLQDIGILEVLNIRLITNIHHDHPVHCNAVRHSGGLASQHQRYPDFQER